MKRYEYAAMKARQEIVAAVINNGASVDINLVPALMDYVETGNRELFDEYNEFRKVTDTEKKAKVMAERLTQAQELIERKKAEVDEVEQKVHKIQEDINAKILSYRIYMKEVRRIISKDYPQIGSPNLQTLQDFIQKRIEQPHGWQSKLWIIDGEKMCTVKAVTFIENKLVMEADNDCAILAPVLK